MFQHLITHRLFNAGAHFLQIKVSFSYLNYSLQSHFQIDIYYLFARIFSPIPEFVPLIVSFFFAFYHINFQVF